jgi:uncharacterized protein YjiS (DUF1127 family)
MLHRIKFAGAPRHTDRASTRTVWTFAMSAHLADSKFNHRLPSLSYIDAKWEEPELRQQTQKVRARRGFTQWLAARVTGFQAWLRDYEAAGELAAMSDRELLDIGLTRSDLVRVFDPELSQDLRQRSDRF